MSATFSEGYGLVVGAGGDLPVTVADATVLAATLRDPERCAYPADQVACPVGPDATRAAILAALDNLARVAPLQSTVVFYFSGHGECVTDGNHARYFLLPFGYDRRRLNDTAISGTELAAKLKAVRAERVLIVLDCCHAGGFDSTTALPLGDAPFAPLAVARGGKHGRVLIGASRADELSYTAKPYSVLTTAVVEALNGVGVAKADGRVRVDDLIRHVGDVVTERSGQRQHPTIQRDSADNFDVCYYAGGDTVQRAPSTVISETSRPLFGGGALPTRERLFGREPLIRWAAGTALAELNSAPSGTTLVLGLWDVGGMGKTAVVNEVCWQLYEQGVSVFFADGAGYDAARPAAGPHEIFNSWAGHHLAGSDRTTATLRAELQKLLGTGRNLLVADNINDAHIVAELAPQSLDPGQTCVVLWSSRDDLGGEFPREHFSCQAKQVGPLDRAAAVEMLTVGNGELSEAEHQAAGYIAETAFAGYPLGIYLTRQYLLFHQDLSLADYADAIRLEGPLAALSQAGAAIELPFRLSYEHLDDSDRQNLQLLCAIGTGTPSIWEASMLFNLSPGDTYAALRRLSTLITPIEYVNPSAPISHMRWRIHDLVRTYVQQRSGPVGPVGQHEPVEPVEPVDSHRRAGRRLAFSRLSAALWGAGWHALGMLSIDALRQPGELAPSAVGADVAELIDRDPSAWLVPERPVVLSLLDAALEDHDDDEAVHLGMLLARLSERIPPALAEQSSVLYRFRHAAAAAGRQGLTRVEAEMFLASARVWFRGGQYDKSQRDLHRAPIACFMEAGDRAGEAALRSLAGDVLRERGQWQEAADQLTKAAELYAATGRAGDRTEILSRLARIHRYQGDWDAAHRELLDGIDSLPRDRRTKRTGAQLKHDLGDLERDQGRLEDALGNLQDALTWYEEEADELGAARVLSSYVDVRRDRAVVLGEPWELVRHAFDGCDEVFARYGDLRWRWRTLLNLAIADRYRGHQEGRTYFASAYTHACRARDGLAPMDDPKGHAMAEETMAAVRLGLARHTEDRREREDHLAAAKESVARARDYFQGREQLWLAKTLWTRGRIAGACDVPEAGGRDMAEAEAIFRRLGAMPQSAYEPYP